MSQWLTQPAHARWLEHETDRLFAFARASAVDTGGFAWLDFAGRPDTSRPLELWITCRMTHVFSLAHLMGRPGAAPLVDHGVDALRGLFADETHGGWYTEVFPDGAAKDASKSAYGHAFVILAASSATAAGRPHARELLDQALSVSSEHFWDDAAGMVIDSWDPTFSQADPYRGVNANMHTVEAYMAASDVTGDPLWRERAARIIDRVVNVQARTHDWRIPEHYTQDWEPQLEYNRDIPADQFRPYGVTPGHGLEWSRLTLELRAALGDHAPGWMADAARELFTRAVSDGWGDQGKPGFVYTTDWNGTPVVTPRLHWVAAEATAAAATLFRATGETAYAEAYETWWDYIFDQVIDHQEGSWFHELNPDGTVGTETWPGKPDAYHAVQATLIPRLPLTPSIAPALAKGLLDQVS